MARKIEKLSLDDINNARLSASSNGTPFSVSQNDNKDKKYQRFVAQLQDEDIIKFFEPYGIISFDRDEEKPNTRAIRVYCLDFVCAFSDYDVIVERYADSPNIVNENLDINDQELFKYSQGKTSFDFFDFQNYCIGIETTPEKAIEARIVDELLGGLKNYPEKYSKKMSESLENNFSLIPDDYQSLMKAAYDDQQLLARKDEIKKILKKYGSFENIEALLAQIQK